MTDQDVLRFATMGDPAFTEMVKAIEVIKGFRARLTDRPLILLDIESTGLDPLADRIVSLAMLRIYPKPVEGVADWEQSEYEDRLGRPLPEPPDHIRRVPGATYFYRIYNPGKLIPEEAIAVHGITNARVQGQPFFDDIHAAEVYRFLRYPTICHLGGYNISNFDIPLLYEEFARAGIEDFHWGMGDAGLGVWVVDASNIFRKKEERTLGAALKFFCQEEMQNAHDARADVNATVKVLLGQLRHYPDLGAKPLGEVAAWASDKERVDLCGTLVRNAQRAIVFNTKRNKGVPVLKDPSYAKWMLGADFHSHTKKCLQQILQGKLT